MSALVAKEIRLLLPSYGMALLLAVVPVCLFRFEPTYSNSAAMAFIIYPFGFGCAMLALSSFGREFGLKTFPLILAQPLERSRIWRTKVALLAGALATVFGAWCVSWFIGPLVFLGSGAIEDTLLIGATTTIVVFAGALWTTLLLRQVIAAFWFTILIPGAILMVIDLCHGTPISMFAAMIIYSVAGFWLAWWQFSRAQEAAWTGGVINFPGWRSANGATQSTNRNRRPIAALFWKELQMQQVSLLGMTGLFALHLGVVWLRKAGHFVIGDTTRTALEVFGGLWFIVPVLTGCLSVSEERKLGTMQELLCLPVSRRVQFFIKLVVTLVLGGLLSALLLWTAEGIGSVIGAGSDIAGLKIPFAREPLVVLSLGFLGLSLIGFYASTLTRGIVQALAAAVAVTIVVWLFMIFAARPESMGIRLWRGFLVLYVALPTLIGTFLWLAWRNFRSSATDWFLWRCNLLGVPIAFVFIVTSTTAIYNRAWELLTPFEPAHGPARLTGPKPTELHNNGNRSLAALLPDGGLWVDRIDYDIGRLILALGQEDTSQYLNNENPTGFRVGEKWISLSGNHIVAGSNWVDAVALFRDTVGIRADGTLWVSEKPLRGRDSDDTLHAEDAAGLVRFGNGTNWQSVVGDSAYSAVLLKQDGTMWHWGRFYSSKEQWPGLRNFEPYRLGTDFDWTEVLTGRHGIYGWRKDGRAWVVRPPEKDATNGVLELEPGGMVMERVPILDNIKWKNLADYMGQPVGLREDGTLWAWYIAPPPGAKKGGTFQPKIVQIGKDTNWVEVAGFFGRLAALRTDGSLWAWDHRDENWNPDGVKPEFWTASQFPIRLGTHTDWLAVGYAMRGVVSLAADGSLWYWWDGDNWYESDQPMLAPSRRPSKIENIFAKEK